MFNSAFVICGRRLLFTSARMTNDELMTLNIGEFPKSLQSGLLLHRSGLVRHFPREFRFVRPK